MSISLTLDTGNITNVSVSEPDHLRVLTAMAVEQKRLEVLASLLARTYHLGTQPTPGRAYDDRLTTRLGVGHNMAYAYLELPVGEGGLRHSRLGKKYIVTEEAVRDFFGDSRAVA